MEVALVDEEYVEVLLLLEIDDVVVDEEYIVVLLMVEVELVVDEDGVHL